VALDAAKGEAQYGSPKAQTATIGLGRSLALPEASYLSAPSFDASKKKNYDPSDSRP
jgi:hypothetical protein